MGAITMVIRRMSLLTGTGISFASSSYILYISSKLCVLQRSQTHQGNIILVRAKAQWRAEVIANLFTAPRGSRFLGLVWRPAELRRCIPSPQNAGFSPRATKNPFSAARALATFAGSKPVSRARAWSSAV